ncbi:MAG TPA: hypothetical protein V6D20_07890 [Candidatus Obscuribacterales bacterium]
MNRRFLGLLGAIALLSIACGGSPEPDGSSPPPASDSEAVQDDPVDDLADDPASSVPAEPAPSSPQISDRPSVDETQVDPLADTTVIPGERVGPITRDTNRQQLAAIFGEDQLRDEAIAVGEGFEEPGTWVELEEGRSLAIIWTDETRSRPFEVRELGPAWHTPEGVHTGMDLAELKQVLGDFQFYGFAWDYGGTIQLDNSRLDAYRNVLYLRMRLSHDEMSLYEGDYPIMGDTLFPSDHPRLDEVEPVVHSMIVVLNPHDWSD